MPESVLNIPAPPRPPIERKDSAPRIPFKGTQDLKSAIHRELVNKLDLDKLMLLPDGRSKQQMLGVIQQLVGQQEVPLSAIERDALAREVMDEVFGFGPLEPLLQDHTVNDILVNTYNTVYVERNGVLEETSVVFKDNVHLMHIIDKIVSRVGRRVDESSPMVDARLPDGSRVNVIVPPLAVDGPILSIRRFGSSPLTAQDLLAKGAYTPEMLEVMDKAVRARLNIVVSGGTGAGKTTLLNVLSGFISERERIVTIEDTAELQLQQPHVISLETRPPSLEGTGQVTQRDLVWNALRMRPDRIVVGEVRGPEAFDMLQAMNTGHDGSISTVHANSARDALTRIENMVQMGQANLPLRAIRSQIVAALDVIVQVERMRDGQRRVIQISEVIGLEGDVITTNDIAAFEYEEEDVHGRISGTYRSTHAIPKFKTRLSYYGLDRAWAEAMRQL